MVMTSTDSEGLGLSVLVYLGAVYANRYSAQIKIVCVKYWLSTGYLLAYAVGVQGSTVASAYTA